ncbi:pentapeptide repeat-containing protein [Rothia sp. HSID18067]|nr:pentapeptide repeat-containing protein [Rothia sp. HSID18067]
MALIALGETRRKNDNDKLKNDQDKEKNDREHERWVKAERRERYAKAVEQLGDEKAPVRMGGVYTLVGLVDDWLEEKSLSDDERLKAGQAIINNLCAYIRSPFPLASYYDELSQASPTSEGIYKDKEEEFYADKAVLESEADVRFGIIKEMHDHIQASRENDWGPWSNFEYNFSGSVFFYPVELTKSYYKKPVNFSGSHYYKKVDFSGSTYEKDATFSTSNFRSTYQGWADFTGSTYQGGAHFSRSTYQGWADFSRSTYQGEADFTGSTYQGWADFTGSTYQGGAHFSDSTYQGWADFSRSTYQGEADFRGSTYQGEADFRGSTYQGWAHFSRSTYQDEADFLGSTYQGGAYFSSSTYQGRADFRNSTYKWANFSDSTYQGWANFSRSTYENETDFSGSIFYQETYFGKDKYNNSSSCFTNHAPQFYGKKNRKNTLFGSHNNDFTVDIDKGYPINLNSEGLPLGCKFLTSEQKEYLEDKFQEIDETNNKLLEAKDDEEKVRLSDMLRSLYKELYEWWEEATTVKVEDVAAEDTES